MPRRAYLRSIITRIEVSKEKVRIVGDTNVLAGAVSGEKDGPQNVRGYVRNWRTGEKITDNTYVIDIVL
jgi:hypothetical protein